MILMDDIIREGHPTLRLQAQDVLFPLSSEDIETARLMMEYLRNGQDPELCMRLGIRPGVGIAAPQINISKKIIAIRIDAEQEMILINPAITHHSDEIVYIGGGEGCLSVDRIVEGIVPRYSEITVDLRDFNGKKETITITDYLAVVFQHEIDHLNGILFVDRINTADPLTPPEGAREI
jgi:peptide deformylase